MSEETRRLAEEVESAGSRAELLRLAKRIERRTARLRRRPGHWAEVEQLKRLHRRVETRLDSRPGEGEEPPPGDGAGAT